ncbi:RidA family protein [Nonomuraea sp. NPDC050783]|uniref:RidA family protein n=1 Tax=Nonomuraea sp. NPDC050783 TaxID=3154634 RepID=UPI003466C505
MAAVHEPVHAPHHPPTAARYSSAVRLPAGAEGSLLFISGQVAKDDRGNPTAIGDPAAQTHVIFDLITDILREAGGDLNNLVSVVIHLVNIADLPSVSKVRNERLADPLPASTLVANVALARPEFLVELTATAFVPSRAT